MRRSERTVARTGVGKGTALPFDVGKLSSIKYSRNASKTRRKLHSARAASSAIRDKARMMPNAVAMPPENTFRGAAPVTLRAYGEKRIREASQRYSRSFAKSRTSTTSFFFGYAGTVLKCAAHPLDVRPQRFLNFMCGAQYKRMRSMDSVAAYSARDPGPHVSAVTNNSEVPSEGTSPPRPSTQSNPHVLAGRRRHSTRSRALRLAPGAARRISAMYGEHGEFGPQMDVGPQRPL